MFNFEYKPFGAVFQRYCWFSIFFGPRVKDVLGCSLAVLGDDEVQLGELDFYCPLVPK